MMVGNDYSRSVLRILGVAALLLIIGAVLVVDLYLTPWQVPTRVLYAIPIMLAARFLGPAAAIAVVLAVVTASVVDAWLTGIDAQTEALAVLGLVAVGLVSILWSRAEGRATELAEEQARLHQLERQRAEELEESRTRLLEFFSLVAHDLRTPLTAIRGYAQMLSRWDSLSSSRREKIAEGIDASVRRLVRLSSDLLDASRIGAGSFEVNEAPCDLVALCREIVEQRRSGAERHTLMLRARDSHIEGLYDCDRMAQAVGNLVDNAIKYSPEGGEILVTVERVRDRARVSVSDQGIGIVPEDVPKLFQPYARLHRTPEIVGIGLGLYIVKGIVEAHRGTISVRSEPGKGTTFTIDLPGAHSGETKPEHPMQIPANP